MENYSSQQPHKGVVTSTTKVQNNNIITKFFPLHNLYTSLSNEPLKSTPSFVLGKWSFMPKLFQRYFTDDWVSLYLTINAFKISRKVRLNYIHCKRCISSQLLEKPNKRIPCYLQFSKFQFDKNICFSLNRVQHEDTINEEIHSNMHTYIFICQLMGQIPPL